MVICQEYLQNSHQNPFAHFFVTELNSIIDSYNECILLNDAIINDEIVSETEDSSEKETVLDMIDSDEFWEKNNYTSFLLKKYSKIIIF